MKILVTGGAGFIGSAVCRHIVDGTDDAIVNVDKLTYAGNLESLSSIEDSDRYAFEKVDICNPSALYEVFERHKPDAVMHLAAESHVDRSIDGPAEFLQTNVIGTYTLLETTRRYFVKCRPERKSAFRFHHVSTDEVFGDLDDTGALFNEDTPYAPSSPYSATKAASDHLVRAWGRTFGLPVVLTNCSNNYGPYHFPEKLIPLTILNALEGKRLPVYGNGDQIRDWLYVEDHARALHTVITQAPPGKMYVIGGHNERQNIDVVRAICKILDELRPLDGLFRKSLIEFVTDRPGHDKRYAIDASKIERELGWEPQETFESGLRKTVEWYLNNPGWCTHVQDGTYQRQRLGMQP